MKIVLYMDVFAGQRNFFAVNDPGRKPDGMRRFRVEVDIPDLNDPDETVASKTSEVS